MMAISWRATETFLRVGTGGRGLIRSQILLEKVVVSPTEDLFGSRVSLTCVSH